MGKVLHQSGSVTEWKVGGAKYARTALWLYVKSIIVIHRKKRGQTENPLLVLEEKHRQHQVSPWLNPDLIEAVAQKTQTTPEVAALRLHYEFTGQQKKGDRRISATAGRFCRMLYKALVKKFSRQTQ